MQFVLLPVVSIAEDAWTFKRLLRCSFLRLLMAVNLWGAVPRRRISKRLQVEEISSLQNENSQEMSPFRRSPRLAMLLLLRPISYREPRSQRIFKKVRKRTRAVAEGEKKTDVHTQPCPQNYSCLPMTIAVLTLALLAGLGFKMMSQQR
ncbi:uncharacterized protein LOC143828604 [Paroedura picta]|uniref:uncharacterized protein LOC143828604 n=1 Tax=Paroedura picta TaxID=143630 RepID=UPI004055ABBE